MVIGWETCQMRAGGTYDGSVWVSGKGSLRGYVHLVAVVRVVRRCVHLLLGKTEHG